MPKSIVISIFFAGVIFVQLSCNFQTKNVVNNPNNKDSVNKDEYYKAEEKKMFEESRKRFLEDLLELANKQLLTKNIKPLKTQELGTNDLEIRIWVGFGEPPEPVGFILEKKDEKWKAFYLSSNTKTNLKILSTPAKNDWNTFWQKLESKDILIIKDSMELGRDNGYTDASNIFVEIKQGSTYRNYSYVQRDLAANMNEEQKQSWRKLIEICSIISDEFNITLCDKE